ncbi:MAG: hypothetical protein Kow0062_25230 [Acidobacteriota bacterium]
MRKSTRYSSEVRGRAMRLVREGIKEHGSEWSAIVSIAEKIGCSPETLRKWLRQSRNALGGAMTTQR